MTMTELRRYFDEHESNESYEYHADYNFKPPRSLNSYNSYNS